MLSRILDADYDIRRGSQCKMKDFEFYSKAADKIRVMCGHVLG